MSNTTYDSQMRAQLFRDAIRHRWVLLSLFAVAGAGLGILAGASATTTYTSSARVIINPLAGNPFSPESLARRSDQLTDVLTEAQLIPTARVVNLAREKDPTLPTSGAIKKFVAISVPPNTQVIDISYTAARARDARVGAESLATAFLARREGRAVDETAAQRTSVQAATQRAQQNLDTATVKRGSTAAGPARDALDTEIRLYSSQLNQFTTQLAKLEVQDSDPGEIVNHAGAPVASGGPAGLSPAMLAVLGLILGSSVGLLVAALRERSADLLRTPVEVALLGCDVLGELPAPAVAVNDSVDPASPTSQALRFVRTAVCARAPAPSVVATLGLPGHGRGSDAGLDLARALTRAGFQVLIVQAEPKAPAALTGSPVTGGLSDVLLSGADESDVTVQLSPGLSYLAAGDDLLEASEFFGTARMVGLVDRLRARYDYVIVGGPPVTTADGQALAEAADATVLVVDLGVTSQTQVTTIMRSGTEAGWQVLGAVVTEPASLARRLRARLRRRRLPSPPDQDRGAPAAGGGPAPRQVPLRQRREASRRTREQEQGSVVSRSQQQ